MDATLETSPPSHSPSPPRDAEGLRVALAEEGRRNLFFFARDILGWDKLSDTLHREVCAFLARPDRFKLIQLPRGHLKTTLCTISYPLWRVVQNPNLRILLRSATSKNAQNWIIVLQDLMLGNPIFRWLYPELIPRDFQAVRWNQEALEVPRTQHWPEATIEAIGGSATAVSRHYDLIVEDDLVNEDHLISDEQMRKVIDEHRRGLSLFVSPGVGERLTVGNRWAYDDLVSWIETNEPSVAVYKRAAVENDLPIWPESFSLDTLNQILETQGPRIYCTPGDAPVLMANWKAKPISEIQEGEQVVAFDENGPKRRIKPATVLRVHQMEAAIVRIHLRSGRTVYSTPDHPWFAYKGSRNGYRRAEVGLSLLHLEEAHLPKLSDKQRDAASWLAGLYDGEGYARGYNIYIAQSITKNPEVCAKIEEAFRTLELPFGYSDQRVTGARLYFLRGGRSTLRKFVCYVPCVKLPRIAKLLWQEAWGERDPIVAIEPAGTTTVYSLETTEKTYTVYGFLTHNSAQYMNSPTHEDARSFDPSWFRFFDSLPTGALRTYVALDPAISKKKHADRTAIVVVGVDSDSTYYVLDVRSNRWGVDELIDQLFEVVRTWRPVKVAIESLAFQKVLQYPIREAMRRESFSFAIHDAPQQGSNKVFRIMALHEYFNNGSLWLRKGVCDGLVKELSEFPYGAHDDSADALAFAMALARPASKQKAMNADPLLLDNILLDLKAQHHGPQQIWSWHGRKPVAA